MHGIRQIKLVRVIARMNVGGPAVEVEHLMRRIPEARIHQLLITGRVEADEIDYLDDRATDLPVTRIQGLGRSIRAADDFMAFFRVRRALASAGPDIVHTHTAKAGAIGRLAALTLRPRPAIVHTYHGHVLQGYFSSWANLAVRLVERVLARFTDALVAVGPEVRGQILDAGIGSPAKFRVIEPGVQLRSNWTRDTARRSYDLDPQCFTICFVGRLVHIKRPDRMLESVRILHDSGINFRVLVAGGGDLAADLEVRAIELGLPITFLGWVEDVERVFRASDLALLTSDNEGTPISLVQAGLAGVPAVATDVGSVGHVVLGGRTGWLCGTSPAELASALLEAYRDPEERIRRGAAANEYLGNRFSVDGFVAAYTSLYEELASSRWARS